MSHTSTAFSGLHWEADLLEFELTSVNRQIPCSISREALEDAGGGRHATRWQLQTVLDRLQERIIGIILLKLSVAKPHSHAAIHISTRDLNPPPRTPSAMVELARLARG